MRKVFDVLRRDVELRAASSLRQLRAYRLRSVLRIGVLGLMVAAMLIGTAPAQWPRISVLLACYALAGLSALTFGYSIIRWLPDRMGRLALFFFTIIDVSALTGFQFASSGGHPLVRLLPMMLLPVLVGFDVSWRRAAAVLSCTMVGLVAAVILDPEMVPTLGWTVCVYSLVLYGFLCGTAILVARRAEEHTRKIAALSAVREELLAQTMTASEVLQRRVAEAIHDGPLQDVLAVRHELAELAADAPADDRVARALAGLTHASERLRQVTFELHPAVLAQVGLGAAVEQLARSTGQRSGVAITTDIDYPARDPIDPIVFGVVRELLANVVRHSRASQASVRLGIAGRTCRLDVADNGIGITSEAVARRLGLGHIGLAAHRARVDAAGGVFQFLDAPTGTHVRVEVPLQG